MLLTTGLLALALGAVTAYAQALLPAQVGSLANSTGTWMLVAFLLALLARRPAPAAACAALALLALVGGYYAASQLRGNSASTRVMLFWVVAAAVAGPPLGLSAYRVRVDRPRIAAIGVGVPAGVLIGEGIYGLRYIADTTYPPYWWAEMIVGFALLSAVGVFRLRRPLPVTLAVLSTIAVASVFVLVFSHNPLALV